MLTDFAIHGVPLTSASLCVKDGAYWLTGDAEAGTFAVADLARKLGVQAVLRHDNAYVVRYGPARVTEDTGLLMTAFLQRFVEQRQLLLPPPGYEGPSDAAKMRLGASQLLEDEATREATRVWCVTLTPGWGLRSGRYEGLVNGVRGAFTISQVEADPSPSEPSTPVADRQTVYLCTPAPWKRPTRGGAPRRAPSRGGFASAAPIAPRREEMGGEMLRKRPRSSEHGQDSAPPRVEGAAWKPRGGREGAG